MANPTTPQSLSADGLRHAFALACAAQTEGRLEEAREQYLVLLGYLPESALLHYNIGLVYFDLGDFVQALQQFTLSASSGPEDVDTLFNLALCQKKTGDQAAAIATYQRILTTDPDQADCHYNLGGCYRDLHDDEQAIACYQRVLAMDPNYLAAANNLAYLFHRAGEVDQAVLHYTQVLELRPEDESVRYLLASLLGTPLDHAPDAYVRNFFDTYAEGFEHSLVDELGYDNPQKLYECLCNSSARSTAYEHGLDLGCGTGLSGLSFKGVVTVLDGVDLSRNMLTQAATKGCYTLLHPDSISHHLDATGETYDFFLATDVFIYVGDLLKIFTAAQAIARPEALFCFSTEHLAADGFQLLQTGRFAYSHAYIRQIAASTGWTVLALEPTLLRKEREAWITGDLWILRIDTPPA
jgi:predicted TPR repeat methyltransferase